MQNEKSKTKNHMSAFTKIYCVVTQHGGKTRQGFYARKAMGEKMELR
jgi:hypothetical protein